MGDELCARTEFMPLPGARSLVVLKGFIYSKWNSTMIRKASQKRETVRKSREAQKPPVPFRRITAALRIVIGHCDSPGTTGASLGYRERTQDYVWQASNRRKGLMVVCFFSLKSENTHV